MHVVAGIASGQLSLVSYKDSVSNYLITFPVTDFLNWKYVAVLASFRHQSNSLKGSIL